MNGTTRAMGRTARSPERGAARSPADAAGQGNRPTKPNLTAMSKTLTFTLTDEEKRYMETLMRYVREDCWDEDRPLLDGILAKLGMREDIIV